MLKNILHKICTKQEAAAVLNMYKAEGKKIVFTNGCFDIIHKGHIFYLAKARERGDFLIVGLNSDNSIKRLKGEGRPVKEQESRVLTMASFGFVDMVVVFDEDTPLELIETLRPNVLVKGKDYSVENIVGAQQVISWGGVVETIDLEEGFSTSNYVLKLK